MEKEHDKTKEEYYKKLEEDYDKLNEYNKTKGEYYKKIKDEYNKLKEEYNKIKEKHDKIKEWMAQEEGRKEGKKKCEAMEVVASSGKDRDSESFSSWSDYQATEESEDGSSL